MRNHDIWDYACPILVVLFDTRVGRPVKGLVEVSKTGRTKVLDRVRPASRSGSCPRNRARPRPPLNPVR
jgi:glucose dehydrogenase